MANDPRLASTLPLPTRVSGEVLRTGCEWLGVAASPSGRRLVAVRPIPKGTRIFTLVGRERKTPTRYSVQVGRGLHLDPDITTDELELVRRCFWRYMDHACEPTTAFRDRQAIALRDIAEGEPVTFNYNTTEYEMASPFDCSCGSPRCVGLVRGARHLTAAQRARLAQPLADYLR